MPPSIATASPLFAADVTAFAAETGVTDYLIPVWEMTQRVFPAALSIAPVLEYDPEIEGDRHVVFKVEVEALDVEQLAEIHWEWDRELFKVCPATNVCDFGLHVDLRSA